MSSARRDLQNNVRGHCHILPVTAREHVGPERTHEGTIAHAKQAVACDKPVYGIKGPSVLTDFTHYDVIQRTTIDYMHCVLQGICKLLLKLWSHPPLQETFFSEFRN